MPTMNLMMIGLALSSVLPPAGAGKLEARSGHALVNGLSIYYEIHGQPHPGQPPLLLLHGGGSTLDTSFARLIPLLAASREVIAFDQAGHGRTPDRDSPFSFHQSAEDAVALLRQLGVGRVDVLGYSNGGHIALELALAHPDLIRRQVIQSAMFDRDGGEPAFWTGFDHARLEEMPPELSRAYLAVAPKPDLPSMFRKSVERMKAFRGWTEEQIRSIAAPTLVLCGDRDVVRPEHAVRMFRLLPRGHLAVLPATDHMKMVEQRAGWVSSLVSDFLDAPDGN